MAKVHQPRTYREMAEELAVWERAFREISRQRRSRRSLLDPFELLKRLIDKGLQLLERAVSWLVDRILRWNKRP